MARPKKQGLDYFPLDVNVDNKLEILESEYGILGFGFIIRLFQKIYANGYYLEWNQYSAALLKKEIGVEKETINEIINFCLEINIFDKKLYNSFQILTSRGIQKRYFTVCKRRKEVEVIKKYLLVKPENYGVIVVNNVNENGVNVDNNSINGNDNAQIEREIETEIETESNKTKLNKTKLNNLFIYMITGQKNSESFPEIDREAIITTLKRLEIYIQNMEQLQYLPENRILEYKLQYWTIKEIHFSPYKVYLNTITRDKFLLKFLQTQKYITINNEEKINDFISYFIKSLREEFTREEQRNVTN